MMYIPLFYLNLEKRIMIELNKMDIHTLKEWEDFINSKNKECVEFKLISNHLSEQDIIVINEEIQKFVFNN